MARFRLYKRGSVWWIDGKFAHGRVRESSRETERRHAETYAIKREGEERRREEFGDEAVITFGAAAGLYLDAGKSDRYLKPIFDKWEHRLVKDIKPGNVHDLSRGVPSTTRPPLRTGPDTCEPRSAQRVLSPCSRFIPTRRECAKLQPVCANMSRTVAHQRHSRFLLWSQEVRQ